MGVTFIAKEGTYTAPAKLVAKEITENGTYNATDDSANGYSSVTVEVEGGGGSSDFSTAQVTFNSNTTETVPLMLPVATEEGVDIELSVRNGRTLEVPLYNGSCIVSPNDNYEGDFTDFSATGDISIDAEASYIIVSGDGTITYTPAL